MDVETRFASALENLSVHDVKARLCPDTQTMQFVAKGLPEWLARHLEDCRPVYTEALRHAAGICIRCGLDPARHPNQGGRRQVFGADGLAALVPSTRLSKLFGYAESVWEEVAPAPGSMPALWCAACYDRGAWENWASGGEIPMKGGPRAKSATERERDDKLFDGIGDGDDPGEEQESLFSSATPEAGRSPHRAGDGGGNRPHRVL